MLLLALALRLGRPLAFDLAPLLGPGPLRLGIRGLPLPFRFRGSLRLGLALALDLAFPLLCRLPPLPFGFDPPGFGLLLAFSLGGPLGIGLSLAFGFDPLGFGLAALFGLPLFLFWILAESRNQPAQQRQVE